MFDTIRQSEFEAVLGLDRCPERKKIYSKWKKIAREALAGTDAGTVPRDLFNLLVTAIKKRKPLKPDIQKRLNKFACDLRALTDSPGAGP